MISIFVALSYLTSQDLWMTSERFTLAVFVCFVICDMQLVWSHTFFIFVYHEYMKTFMFIKNKNIGET